MKDNSLPEERLLKFIRKDKHKPLKGAKDKTKARSAITAGLNNFSGFFFSEGRLFKIAVILAVLSLALLILSILNPFLKPMTGLELDRHKDLDSSIIFEKAKEQKPLESYLQEIGKRNIFNSPLLKKEVKKILPSQALGQITLLGIISQDPPQAIVNDTKTNMTYYLKEGDSFKDFKVLEILKGKIIVEYDRDEFELHL